MNEPYPIIFLPPDARNRDEQMGTKEKFWFVHTDGNLWLFKFNRKANGEDWSEKIASEIAEALILPHAHVELSTYQNKPGIISRDFTKRGEFPLIHGNELLATSVGPRYPKNQKRKVTEHTAENIRLILDQVRIRPLMLDTDSFALAGYDPNLEDVANASNFFAGYLMLDALVGNTDRHHENWAIVRVKNLYCLAPTFDHASCLGFNLSDDARNDMMARDRNRSVKTFADKARSKLYHPGAEKLLTPLEAFEEFTKDLSEARHAWIDRLRQMGDNDFQAIIDRVPPERMSKPARKFAYSLLRVNRDRIVNLEH